MEKNTLLEPPSTAINKQSDVDAATLMKENHMEEHHSSTRTAHFHHQPGGIILHCEDSDCEAESKQLDENSNQPLCADHISVAVPNSIASSSGFDRQNTEILRSMHPMRNEIVGASDDICLDTEHSSVQGINTGQPSTSPWLANNGNFLDGRKPLKADLILPQPSIHIENNVLQLDEADYTPISIGWGFSLLGFFMGRRFPGKDAVHNLTKRWKAPCRTSFHPRGWIIFRFETEEQAKTVITGGPYSVFGISLILCHLPPEFRFDSSPILNFKVWASLPNLPLELWNASAISKIAATVGTPLEVDYQTISKNHIAGPRVLILVDATKEAPNSITLKLHTGNTFVQAIELDYFPAFCTQCRRAGHSASACRVLEWTNPGTSTHPRTQSKPNADGDGWKKVERRRSRNGRSTTRKDNARSKSRAPINAPRRSISRPSKQEWRVINSKTPAAPPNHFTGAIPKTIENTHIRFSSPNTTGASHFGDATLKLSNQFQAIDDLEQIEDAAAMEQHTLNRPHFAPTTSNLASVQMPNIDNAAAKAAQHPTRANIQQLAAGYDSEGGQAPAINNAAAPTDRYRPPAVRHENTVRDRVNSSDTFSTDCICAENGAVDDSQAAHAKINKDQPNTPPAAPTTNNDQVHATYANALSSPNILLDAGKKQNQGKQRADAKMLDPRNAIKNKKNQANLFSTGGRVLMNNTSKNRK